MAASYRITTVLFFLFPIFATAQNLPEQPKRNIFKKTTHWVASHKKVVVISAGATAASSFAAWKLTRPQTPIVNDGPAVPCPSSACITRH